MSEKKRKGNVDPNDDNNSSKKLFGFFGTKQQKKVKKEESLLSREQAIEQGHSFIGDEDCWSYSSSCHLRNCRACMQFPFNPCFRKHVTPLSATAGF